MKHARCTATVLALALSVAAQIPTRAQAPTPTAAVKVAASGSFAKGGEFEGTFTINRFEQRGNHIVAIGVLSGALSRGSQTLGSALVAEVEWPVAIRAGGQVLASAPARTGARTIPVAYRAESRPPEATLIAQEACPVVNVALGPHTVDVLGVLLTLDPVGLHLTGDTNTALGALVCQAVALIGNVAGLVGVLNNILALLTALLGGLTGGLGGPVPVP